MAAKSHFHFISICMYIHTYYLHFKHTHTQRRAQIDRDRYKFIITYICRLIYIHIHIHRERERDTLCVGAMASNSSTLWVLIGMGITGVMLFCRRKNISSSSSSSTKDRFRAFISQLNLHTQEGPSIPLRPLAKLTFAIADV